ncbi:rod shape-determining protein MreC [Candidatus Gracilibacteria bacterium]|nr:rod shape-determining protein MreC [Candidatus Gracilibacteria bacterium]
MRDYLDDRPIKLRRERSNTPASWRTLLLALALCAAVVALMLVDQAGRLGPARGLVQQVLTPITTRLVTARDAVGSLFTQQRGEAALRERVSQLEQEVGQLRAQLLEREQAQIENVTLRQQLSIERATPWQLLGAEVAMRSPDAGRRVMVIARGSDDGVQPGMAVIGQTGGNLAALVGIVESVGPHSADVLMITDFGSQVSARVLHANDAYLGLVQGQWQRGSRLKLEQIERGATVEAGDAVVTAGLTSLLDLPLALATLPPNIPIGSVETVSTAGYNQVAELRPYVDPDQVRYVWVILNQDD